VGLIVVEKAFAFKRVRWPRNLHIRTSRLNGQNPAI
jgi:hypothetical protein